MRVKMRQSGAGPMGTWGSGDIINIPENAAKHLLETKQATIVDEEVKVIKQELPIEVAAEEQIENASLPSPARRRRAKE